MSESSGKPKWFEDYEKERQTRAAFTSADSKLDEISKTLKQFQTRVLLLLAGSAGGEMSLKFVNTTPLEVGLVFGSVFTLVTGGGWLLIKLKGRLLK